MSQRIEIILDDQGHLVLTPSVQHQLGLFPGMTLVVEREEDDTTYLRVQEEPTPIVDRQGILVVQSEAVGDLEESVAKEREQRLAHLLEQVDP